MGVAIAAITIGAWLVYSALKGESLAEVFGTQTGALDPAGRAQVLQDTLATLQPEGTNAGSMEAEMDRMIALHQPYKWGGGHGGFSQGGPWDCSGAVSSLLHYMG